MTSNIIKPIIKGLKELYPIVKPYIKFGVLGAIVLFFVAISDKWEKVEINKSFKDSILHEIQVARNKLDYTLAQKQLNVRSRPNFSLEHSAHVSESFADNLALKTDITTLYQSLSSAQESAKELMLLLSKSDSNPQTIQNKEGDIKRAISLADEVGPKIAEFIGSTWQKPPANLTPQQKVKFYEDNGSLIYSVASDAQVDFRWQIK